MDREAYKRKLEERAKANRDAFNGIYKTQIEGLMGLSKDEIDAITPGTTDLEVYAQMISVVKEASASNIKQADLKESIEELGDVAVAIAKKVPALLALFA